jgi:hypothetical protein
MNKICFVHQMNRRRISIKFTDQKGILINFSLEGPLDLPTLLKYLTALGCFYNGGEINDISDLENIFDDKGGFIEASSLKSPDSMKNSLTDEIRLVIESLSGTWFTSKDVKRIYEERFNKQIQLSKVSTYLARLYDKGFLSRLKNGKSFKYKIEVEVQGQLKP